LPLPYEPSEIEEVEVNDEEIVDSDEIALDGKTAGKNDDDGQTALF
jgi:hypothetical protein